MKIKFYRLIGDKMFQNFFCSVYRIKIKVLIFVKNVSKQYTKITMFNLTWTREDRDLVETANTVAIT